MTTSSAVHPVATLRCLANDLEAGILRTSADPARQHVHQLRVLTRRIEAQLLLLDLLKFPPAAAGRSRLRHHLRRLRRAAGIVRDLDVQRSTLKDGLAHSEKKLATSAGHLRRHLKHIRSSAADHLLHTLEPTGHKLARRLEDLLADLAKHREPSPTAARVAQLVRSWYTGRIPSGAGDQGASTTSSPGRLSSSELHTIRKFAKLARYLAESATATAVADTPLPPPLRQLARNFEALQETGGKWHDALTLSHAAAHHLGRRDPLTLALRKQTAELFQTYQQHLAAFHA